MIRAQDPRLFALIEVDLMPGNPGAGVKGGVGDARVAVGGKEGMEALLKCPVGLLAITPTHITTIHPQVFLEEKAGKESPEDQGSVA